MKRIRVGVLAGGASAEREISLASGLQIAEQLPKDRFEVVLLDPLALMAANPAIDAELRDQARRLLAGGGAREALPERDRELPAEFQAQMLRASSSALPATQALGASGGPARVDVAFIALHGPWGEDGTLQGLLETLGIPYTGSGVLASALAMDKVMTKTVLRAAGLATANGVVVTRAHFVGDPHGAARVAAGTLPAVVKPVRQGSSIGMSLVNDVGAMRAALAEAFRYDDRALVEVRLRGTELTCGIIGNDELEALPLIEIVPKREFFDYRAKYDPAASDEICPARIPDGVAREVVDAALRAHRALGCRGLSRVDFILVDRMTPVILEVNTMPGMTANSLVPKAARVAGIPFGELLARLVDWALEDAERRR